MFYSAWRRLLEDCYLWTIFRNDVYNIYQDCYQQSSKVFGTRIKSHKRQRIVDFFVDQGVRELQVILSRHASISLPIVDKVTLANSFSNTTYLESVTSFTVGKLFEERPLELLVFSSSKKCGAQYSVCFSNKFPRTPRIIKEDSNAMLQMLPPSTLIRMWVFAIRGCHFRLRFLSTDLWSLLA